jgi:hypothetical protein
MGDVLARYKKTTAMPCSTRMDNARCRAVKMAYAVVCILANGRANIARCAHS